jgi:hypothetical protein
MNKLIACVALCGLVSAPSMASVRAAAFSQSSDINVSRPSMFAGATYRVGFDRRSGTAKGRASLLISGMRMKQDSSGFRLGQGLELTGGKTGKLALHLVGQDVGELKKRAQMSTGGKIAIAVGVVALAGAIAFGVWYREATYCDRNDCE